MVTNVTGWNELTNMKMGSAVWRVLDGTSAFNGYLGLIIFYMLSIVIFMRTGKILPTFVAGFSMYVLLKGVSVTTGFEIFPIWTETLIGITLALEFGGAVYSLIKGH